MAIAIISLGMTSCSKEGDGEDEIPFTKELLVGKWEITNVTGDDAHHIKVGTVMEFNADETCKGWFSMETHYTLMKDRLRTYYGETSEPMFVYVLTGNNSGTLTVHMYGTLDDLRDCIMTWKKVE